MKNTLDFSSATFKALLDKSTDLVIKQFQDLNLKKGYHYFDQKEIETWFDEPVPANGMDSEALFELVEEKVLNTATGNLGANMYAYVMAGGNQVGIIAEKLSSTINQNVAKWHLAPAITEIEKRVIQWAAELIGFGEHVGGFLDSSGSSANLDGLTVARNIFFERQGIREKGLFGMKPFCVYCSDETHNSVDKSVQLLGIGSDHLRYIPSKQDFTIDVEALEVAIKADLEDGFQPFCIIGNAGTVNTGAIDDLTALAALARKYGLWFHVDGAYGGLASCLDSTRDWYAGIEQADSVALDFHKWFYAPFEVGCILVKDWNILRRSYLKEASYLDNSLEEDGGRFDFNEHHFLLSRSTKGFKVWMAIKAYGVDRIKEMIQKDIDLAAYLSEQITFATDFRLIADSPLAISCFQFTGNAQGEEAIEQLNRKLIPALERDGRVFITGTRLKGTFVLRACLINHRKTKATTDYLLDVIRDVAKNLEG